MRGNGKKRKPKGRIERNVQLPLPDCSRETNKQEKDNAKPDLSILQSQGNLMSLKEEEEESSSSSTIEYNGNDSNNNIDTNGPSSYYTDFLNNIFRCQYCKFNAKSKEALNKHRSVHTKEKLHKCNQCNYECHYHGDLIRHHAKHSEEKRFKCPHCDFATKWRRNVRHHLLKHTSERPYQCRICEFSFKRLQDLKYHMYRHNDDKPIKCDECEFCCKTNYELKCHKLKHSDVRHFPCTYVGCTQQCKTKSDLTKHLKTHNGERSHICPLCRKGFTTVGCLNKHVQRHDTRKQFICHLCQKKFKSKASLKNHLRIHDGIRPFVCDVCGKTFSNKYNMMKHQETHGDNRPFRCPICPYGARSSEHLLAHIGSMHGHSYAYFCELCKKPFRRHGQLRIHLKRMHKGSKEATAAADFTRNSSSDSPFLSTIKGGKVQSAVTCDEEKSLGSSNDNGSLDDKPPSVSKSIKDGKGFEAEEANSLIFNSVESSSSSLTKPMDDFSGSPSSENFVNDDESNQNGQLKEAMENKSQLLTNDKNNNENESDKDDDNNSDIGSKAEDSSVSGTCADLPSATPTTCLEGFHLPLATKGFTFNFQKKGKKPRSWFMDPNNMPADAAEKQIAYLSRKAKMSGSKQLETSFRARGRKKKLKTRDKSVKSPQTKNDSSINVTNIYVNTKKKHIVGQVQKQKTMLSGFFKKRFSLARKCKVKIEPMRYNFNDIDNEIDDTEIGISTRVSNDNIVQEKNDSQFVLSVNRKRKLASDITIQADFAVSTKVKQEPLEENVNSDFLDLESSSAQTITFETHLKSELRCSNSSSTESKSKLAETSNKPKPKQGRPKKKRATAAQTADKCGSEDPTCASNFRSTKYQQKESYRKGLSDSVQIAVSSQQCDTATSQRPIPIDLKKLSMQKSHFNQNMPVYRTCLENVDIQQSLDSKPQRGHIFNSEEINVKQEPEDVGFGNSCLINQTINSPSSVLNPDLEIKTEKGDILHSDMGQISSSPNLTSKSVSSFKESNPKNTCISESSHNSQRNLEAKNPLSTDSLVDYGMVDTYTSSKHLVEPSTFPDKNTFSVDLDNNDNRSNNSFNVRLQSLQDSQAENLTLCHSFVVDSNHVKYSSKLEKQINNECDFSSNPITLTSKTSALVHYQQSVVPQDISSYRSSTSKPYFLPLPKSGSTNVMRAINTVEMEQSSLGRNSLNTGSHYPEFHSDVEVVQREYQVLRTDKIDRNKSNCSIYNSSKYLECNALNLTNKIGKSSGLGYSETSLSPTVLRTQPGNHQHIASNSSTVLNTPGINPMINRIQIPYCPVLRTTPDGQCFPTQSLQATMRKEKVEEVRDLAINFSLPAKNLSEEARALYEYEMQLDEKSIFRDNTINLTMLGPLSESYKKPDLPPTPIISCVTPQTDHLTRHNMDKNYDNNKPNDKTLCGGIKLISTKQDVDREVGEDLTKNVMLYLPSC